MATNTVLAAKTLRDAAGFYRIISTQNPHFSEDLEKYARKCETMGELLEHDPHGANAATA